MQNEHRSVWHSLAFSHILSTLLSFPLVNVNTSAARSVPLCAAAGLQTPKVMGTGQTSPRKHAHNLGDPGLDGGAFERLQGGIRRTKR